MVRARYISLQVLLPLVFGSLIYFLFRSEIPFSLYTPLSKPIINISFLPGPVYNFVMYNATDLLWCFAFVSALDLFFSIWWISSVSVFSLTVLFEISQYYGIVRGTGDAIDILCSIFAIAIFLLIKWRRKINEKTV